MYRIIFLAFAILSVSNPLLPAETPPDSQTLQFILEEVRLLRHELQSTATTVQRMQILLYRIRNQMDVVERARQEHEQSQMMLTQSRYQHEQMTNEIKRQRETLDTTQEVRTRQAIEENLERMKNWLEQLDQSEPESQAKEAQCANTLRIEEGKLNELNQQLDQLDAQLAAARRPEGPR